MFPSHDRLGVDSSGNVIEIPIGAGAVDGSGTAGKIVKWSDSDTITDSVISESSGNIQIQGLLGVGLVPDSAVQLSVNGQIGTSNNGNAGAPDFTFYGDDNTGMYRVGADSLGFTTGGTNALTLDSSQNTTFAGNITVGDGHFIGDDSFDNLLLQSSSGENLNLSSANDVIIYTGGTAPDSLGTQRLRIFNSDGSATFAGDVEVTGTLTIDGDGASNAEITSSTASSIVSLNVGGFTGTPSLARDVRFFTNSASGSKTERARLDSSGQLVLGTTSASSKLHIRVANNTNDVITLDSPSANNILMGGLGTGTTYITSFEGAFEIGNTFSGGS